MLFIIHVYLIMCLRACDKLVATPLLKLWPLKGNHSQPVSAFWASWSPCYICWVRLVLTLPLLFKSLEKSWMGTRLLEFRGISVSLCCGLWPSDTYDPSLLEVGLLWFANIIRDNLCETSSIFYHSLHVWYLDILTSFMIFGLRLIFIEFKNNSHTKIN